MIQIYRVQDAAGRGPFRPGFSHNWADPVWAPGMEELPTWMDEFGKDLIEREGRDGEHYGSAVRDHAGIRRWFSLSERAKLQRLGFNVVSLQADRILAESRHQLVFARGRALNKGAIIVPWGYVDASAFLSHEGQSVKKEQQDASR